jgi:uncharacterized membrane-anchored protein YjiN (DUF445 family)
MQTVPPLQREAARVQELRSMQRRATGLLLVMTAAFVAVVVFGTDTGWQGYLRAGLEASMVGGLADWFAVTALFRHPLGIPIPHTAVIRERKDQFGQTLGDFVQENFLTPASVADRVRASHAVARGARWLAEPANAQTVAGHVSEALVGVADLVRDEDVHRLVETELRRVVDRIPLAPLAGRAVRMMTAGGRHQELFDAIVRGLQQYLAEHRDALQAQFGEQAPWWLPGAVEDRIFDRLLDGVTEMLHAVATDPEHEMRVHFDARLAEFAERLEHSPELQARGEELKRELLAHPELRRWSATLWSDVKATLREQAQRETSPLRSRIADTVVVAAARVRDDPALQRKVEDAVETAVCYVVEQFHDEIGQLVTGTIARWDADETSRRLELLLGRDLQFIRINGTVVGGLAGVAIHAVAEVLG